MVILNNQDFLFKFINNSLFSLYTHVINMFIKCIIVENKFNKPLVLLRRAYLNKIIKFL